MCARCTRTTKPCLTYSYKHLSQSALLNSHNVCGKFKMQEVSGSISNQKEA